MTTDALPQNLMLQKCFLQLGLSLTYRALVVAALDGVAQRDLVGLALADGVAAARVHRAEGAGAAGGRVARIGLLHAPAD